MKCHVCGGRLEPTISDLPFRLGPNSIVVIKQLPVLECSDCTEFSIEDPILEKVDNLLGEMDETVERDPKDSIVFETANDPLVTIDTQILFGIGDGGCRTTRNLALNPGSWRHLVTNLESFQKIRFRDKCLICGKSTTASNGAEEHVVLQGLGIKWSKLPAGIVCKRCNNGCSYAESRLLKLGLLGALRPFYVGSKKEKSLRGREYRQGNSEKRPDRWVSDAFLYKDGNACIRTRTRHTDHQGPLGRSGYGALLSGTTQDGLSCLGDSTSRLGFVRGTVRRQAVHTEW